MAKKRQYTDDFKEEVLAEVDLAKKTVIQIAKKLKIPSTTIYSWITAAGKTPPEVIGTKSKGKTLPGEKRPRTSSKLLSGLKAERDYYKAQMEHFMKLHFTSMTKGK
jgi:transposase-like protein